MGVVSRPRNLNKKKEICCGATHSAYNAMARISHQFAYELIGEHVRHAGPVDVALSPYSIISVLQALSLGARGMTKLEIDSQLKFSANRNHEIMKCSLDSFQQESNATVLVASRLFADEYLMKGLDPVFAKELKYYYDSDVQGVPFSKDPPTAWKAVNKFVEEKTNGIVSDFMNRWDATKLMYVNTIVFKGRWKQQFNTSLTRQGAFFPAPRQHINVPMMTIEGLFRTITISKFRYYGDNLKVVELPYSDDKYNMYIFMAEKGKLELSFMESIINQHTIPAFKSHYLEDQDRPLRVVLPKFKIASEIDISRALYNKGVRKLFSRDADLEGIFTDYPVHFNKMFHKSVIEVTEEGTTAAGATSYTLIRAYEKQEEFIVNRPFVYVIHDACNNMVLFQGRYYGRNQNET